MAFLQIADPGILQFNEERYTMTVMIESFACDDTGGPQRAVLHSHQ
jgi:hypothetical protein